MVDLDRMKALEEAAKLAQAFHEAYERLAPEYGYRTRKESAKPWNKVPEKNRKLMTATCVEIQAMIRDAEIDRLRARAAAENAEIESLRAQLDRPDYAEPAVLQDAAEWIEAMKVARREAKVEGLLEATNIVGKSEGDIDLVLFHIRARIAELEKEATPAPKMVACPWTEDSEGIWTTGCGITWETSTGTPSDNKMRYCPMCGRPLDERPWGATVYYDDEQTTTPAPALDNRDGGE